MRLFDAIRGTPVDNCSDYRNGDGMEPHYHVWVRSGRVFSLVGRPYTSRSHAAKVAAELREDPQDRMVRACTNCPPSKRSRRRPPRWARVATKVAEVVGADPGTVHQALKAALEADRTGSLR